MKGFVVNCLIAFLACSALVECDDNQSFKEVKIQGGAIRGKEQKTIYNSKSFYSFRGVPFAKPPVDKLRFLPPQAPEPWSEPLNAFDYKSACTQLIKGAPSISGNEDCLYINIFTPDTNPSKKLPVLFYIYGGGFTEGSGDDFIWGPDFIIDKDVILVTFNYRLAVFGFMSLGDDVYSGNMGLKDSHFALQWVHDNIAAFGGDKEQVTIGGHSAGSLSAYILGVAPSVSNKLFKRIILQGLPNESLIIQPNIDHRDALIKYAHYKGATGVETNEDLLEFLLKADAYEMYEKTIEFRREAGGLAPFSPIVEYAAAKAPVLPDIPENLQTDKLQGADLLVTFNSHEFFFLTSEFINNPAYVERVNQNSELFLPSRKFPLKPDSQEYKAIVQDIREFYFGENEINLDAIYEYVDAMSDQIFVYNSNELVKLHAEHGPGNTFYARFSIEGKLNLLKTLENLTSYNMTTHGDELCYIFKCSYFNDVYATLDEDSLERETIESMTTLLTNFIKYGNPTPEKVPVEWQPVTSSSINFLDISNEGLHLAQNPNFKSAQFWDNLFTKYEHFAVDAKTVKTSSSLASSSSSSTASDSKRIEL